MDPFSYIAGPFKYLLSSISHTWPLLSLLSIELHQIILTAMMERASVAVCNGPWTMSGAGPRGQVLFESTVKGDNRNCQKRWPKADANRVTKLLRRTLDWPRRHESITWTLQLLSQWEIGLLTSVFDIAGCMALIAGGVIASAKQHPGVVAVPPLRLRQQRRPSHRRRLGMRLRPYRGESILAYRRRRAIDAAVASTMDWVDSVRTCRTSGNEERSYLQAAGGTTTTGTGSGDNGSSSANSRKRTSSSRRSGAGGGPSPFSGGSSSGGDSDDADADDEEDRPTKRGRIGAVEDVTAEKGPRFACPYYKKNPRKYREWRICCGPGWTTVHRVK